MAQTDNRKIALAQFTHNNFSIKSFEKVLNDERVKEIVILDDHSDQEVTWDWEEWMEFDAPQHVKFSQNNHPIGEEESKRALIVLADTDWVLYVPADQIIDKKFLNELYKHEWNEDILDIDGGSVLINRNSYMKALNIPTETE